MCEGVRNGLISSASCDTRQNSEGAKESTYFCGFPGSEKDKQRQFDALNWMVTTRAAQSAQKLDFENFLKKGEIRKIRKITKSAQNKSIKVCLNHRELHTRACAKHCFGDAFCESDRPVSV